MQKKLYMVEFVDNNKIMNSGETHRIGRKTMAIFFNFETANRKVSIKADTKEEAVTQLINSNLKREVEKKGITMTGEDFEQAKKGIIAWVETASCHELNV